MQDNSSARVRKALHECKGHAPSEATMRGVASSSGESPPPPAGQPAETILVDAHVHLHPGLPVDTVLDHARRNFAAGARASGLSENSRGVLLLTEIAGVRRFDELHGQAVRGKGTGDWSFIPAGEDGSLEARHAAGDSILILAGRQISVEGKLEVLALCTTEHFTEGGRLQDTLAAVNESGAVAVVPWGFGKWWGARGRLVREALRGASPGSFLLGDNGGRPRGTVTPRIFALAHRVGIPVLAGSDPLPLAEHVARAGSYGSLIPAPGAVAGVIPGDLARHPAEWLRKALRSLRASPPTFGTRSSPGSFAREQVRLRRIRSRSAG